MTQASARGQAKACPAKRALIDYLEIGALLGGIQQQLQHLVRFGQSVVVFQNRNYRAAELKHLWWQLLLGNITQDSGPAAVCAIDPEHTFEILFTRMSEGDGLHGRQMRFHPGFVSERAAQILKPLSRYIVNMRGFWKLH